MNTIKPCPFCGTYAQVRKDNDGHHYCYCMADRCPGYRESATWQAATPEIAIADWNIRDRESTHVTITRDEYKTLKNDAAQFRHFQARKRKRAAKSLNAMPRLPKL